MNPEDFLYYLDLTMEVTGERRRIWLTPAGTTTLTSITPFPEWNENPAEGVNIRRIAAGAIQFEEPGEAGYADLPVGLAGTATMKATIHHEKVALTEGLADVLANYTATATLTGNGGVNTWDIETLNVFTITSDMGDGTLTAGEFTAIFQGAQRRLPSRPGRIVFRRRAEQEFELYDLGRAILDTITMRMVCADYLLESGVGPYKRQYDFVWEDSTGATNVWMFQQIYESASLYSLSGLFSKMVFLCSAAYELFLRGSFGAAAFSFLKKGVGNPQGHPYSHIVFYRQSYQRTLERGTSLDIDTEVYFIGAFKLDSDNISVGGLLVEQNDDADTLATDRSCWETLVEMCEGTMCKARLRQLGTSSIALYFTGIYESIDAETDLTLADIVVDGEGAAEEEMEFEEGMGVIANAEGGVQTSGSEDITTSKEKSFGTENEAGFNFNAVLHNMPTIGDGGEDWGAAYADDFSGGGFSGGRRVTSHWWALYYIAQPLNADNNIPIRVHHNADIVHGEATFSSTGTTDAVELPDIFGIATGLTETSYNSMAAAITVIQQQGGMLVGVARAYLDLFGHKEQCGYMLSLPISKASYFSIGEAFNFTPDDANGNRSLQSIAGTTDIDMSHLYGGCFLLKAKPWSDENRAEAVTECTLLGIRY